MYVRVLLLSSSVQKVVHENLPTCADLPRCTSPASIAPSFLSFLLPMGQCAFLSPSSSFHLMEPFNGRPSLSSPLSWARSSSRRVVSLWGPVQYWRFSLRGRSRPLKKIWSAAIMWWLPTENSKLGSDGGGGPRGASGGSTTKSLEKEMRGLIGGAAGTPHKPWCSELHMLMHAINLCSLPSSSPLSQGQWNKQTKVLCSTTSWPDLMVRCLCIYREMVRCLCIYREGAWKGKGWGDMCYGCMHVM